MKIMFVFLVLKFRLQSSSFQHFTLFYSKFQASIRMVCENCQPQQMEPARADFVGRARAHSQGIENRVTRFSKISPDLNYYETNISRIFGSKNCSLCLEVVRDVTKLHQYGAISGHSRPGVTHLFSESGHSVLKVVEKAEELEKAEMERVG